MFGQYEDSNVTRWNKLKFFVENVLFTCCFSGFFGGFWGVFPNNAGGPLLHLCLFIRRLIEIISFLILLIFKLKVNFNLYIENVFLISFKYLYTYFNKTLHCVITLHIFYDIHFYTINKFHINSVEMSFTLVKYISTFETQEIAEYFINCLIITNIVPFLLILLYVTLLYVLTYEGRMIWNYCFLY